jgi:UDP-N-acetylglucosamine acyltransferase
VPIHPSAVVHPKATVDPTATIEPFCTIGEHVVIGANCRIGPHAHIANRTTLGDAVRVFPFASVGEDPPDLKFRGEPATLEVGARTVIHEGATLSIGTESGGMKTIVGSDCLIMSYCHVGHDSLLGNMVIMANGAQLGGHVIIDDGAILGALSGVHQFCRIGSRAFLAGGAKVTKDVPPWCVAHGDRATLNGLNLERMRREQLGDLDRKMLKRVYRLVVRKLMSPDDAAAEMGDDAALPQVAAFLDFVRNSERGVLSGRRIG